MTTIAGLAKRIEADQRAFTALARIADDHRSTLAQAVGRIAEYHRETLAPAAALMDTLLQDASQAAATQLARSFIPEPVMPRFPVPERSERERLEFGFAPPSRL